MFSVEGIEMHMMCMHLMCQKLSNIWYTLLGRTIRQISLVPCVLPQLQPKLSDPTDLCVISAIGLHQAILSLKHPTTDLKT